MGLQLEQPAGAGSNGIVDGIKYFDAPLGCALFVKAAILKPLTSAAVAAKKS